jgi:hypothetical protein
MSRILQVISEAMSRDSAQFRAHNNVARQKFENLRASAGTIGQYSGVHRKHVNHLLGVGNDYYGTDPAHERKVHEYAFKSDILNRGPDQATYGAVRFPEGTSIEGLHELIAKQNPHLEHMGHGTNLARDIIERHKGSKVPVRSREDPYYDGPEGL